MVKQNYFQVKTLLREKKKKKKKKKKEKEVKPKKVTLASKMAGQEHFQL